LNSLLMRPDLDFLLLSPRRRPHVPRTVTDGSAESPVGERTHPAEPAPTIT